MNILLRRDLVIVTPIYLYLTCLSASTKRQEKVFVATNMPSEKVNWATFEILL